jgi:hypothetical protein
MPAFGTLTARSTRQPCVRLECRRLTSRWRRAVAALAGRAAFHEVRAWERGVETAGLRRNTRTKTPRPPLPGWQFKAEGTGLEPATGCPAPHFQLLCAPFRCRPELSQAIHGCGVGATPKIRQHPPLFATVRPLGYKVVTLTAPATSRPVGGRQISRVEARRPIARRSAKMGRGATSGAELSVRFTTFAVSSGSAAAICHSRLHMSVCCGCISELDRNSLLCHA